MVACSAYSETIMAKISSNKRKKISPEVPTFLANGLHNSTHGCLRYAVHRRPAGSEIAADGWALGVRYAAQAGAVMMVPESAVGSGATWVRKSVMSLASL